MWTVQRIANEPDLQADPVPEGELPEDNAPPDYVAANLKRCAGCGGMVYHWPCLACTGAERAASGAGAGGDRRAGGSRGLGYRGDRAVWQEAADEEEWGVSGEMVRAGVAQSNPAPPRRSKSRMKTRSKKRTRSRIERKIRKEFRYGGG